VRDNRFQVQASILHGSGGANRNLAASAQPVEQGSFARSGRARGLVVQERKVLARDGVAGADFYAEGPLSGSGAHYVRRNDLLDELRLAQAIESGSGEDDGVVFAFVQF